jgi:hypothetical protein
MDVLRGKDEGQSQPRLLTVALDRLLEASARLAGRQQGADEGDLFLAVRPVSMAARWKKSFWSLEMRASSRALRVLSWVSGVFSMGGLARVDLQLDF